MFPAARAETSLRGDLAGKARCLPDFQARMSFLRRAKDRLVTTRLNVSARSALAAAWLVLSALPAAAQGRLEAQYEATLAGISVGRGTWAIEIGEDTYSAAAPGGTPGLLKSISHG